MDNPLFDPQNCKGTRAMTAAEVAESEVAIPSVVDTRAFKAWFGNQIKSATRNSGEYSPSTNRITASDRKYYHSTDVSNRESILKHGLSPSFADAGDGIFFHTKLTKESRYTDTWCVDLTGFEIEPDDTTDISDNPEYEGDSWWVVWGKTIPPDRLTLVQKGKMLTAMTKAAEEIPGVGRQFWHGGRITGQIEIQTPTKGRYEAGPGLYLTTSYQRACKYAKGGGSTFLITLKDNISFADDVLIPLKDGVEFATKYLGGKGKEIAADLRNNCSRRNQEAFTANTIINLVVNYEAGAGAKGKALLQFLQEHNVDAALESPSMGDNGEQWVVVFNPSVVLKVKKVPAADVTPEMRNLPKYA